MYSRPLALSLPFSSTWKSKSRSRSLANVKTLQQYTGLTPLLHGVPLMVLLTKGLDHVQVNHAGMVLFTIHKMGCIASECVGAKPQKCQAP